MPILLLGSRKQANYFSHSGPVTFNDPPGFFQRLAFAAEAMEQLIPAPDTQPA